MQGTEKKIGIVIIAREDNIQNIETTINNLNGNGCTNKDYIIAIKNSSENIKKFCIEKEINSFVYKNEEDIYYDILDKFNFDYISFINEGDTYSPNFKEKLINHLNNTIDNIIVCPIKYIDGNYLLNKNIAKFSEIDIEKNPEKIWIHLNSVFINSKLLKKIQKSTEQRLKYYIDKNLLSKLFLLNGGYEIVHNINLISPIRLEDSPESKIEDYDIDWYNNVFNNIEDISSYSENKFHCVLQFQQYLYVYMIKNIINENVNLKNKHILNESKKNEFFQKVKKVLQDIDDEIIMKTLGNKLVNYYLLRLKYGLQDSKFEYRIFDNRIHVVNKENMIFSASNTKIKILLMDYSDGNLIITANFPFPFDEDKLKIYVQYLDKKIYAQKNYLYSDYKIFGETIYSNYTFDIKIPLKESNQKQYVKFFLEVDETNAELDINFNKPLSRLSNLKYSYWNCGNFTLNYRNKSILIMKNNRLRHIKRELKYIISLLRSKKVEARKAGRLRILYNITKPFFKNEIWLFEDKIYKGGDNGEYLYTYASKQKDGIKKYYILKKDCIDAERFKKEHKKFVVYGTLHHKLLFLNSNIVFETHNNLTKHHGFDELIERYFRDLFNSYNVCIQHGLTVQYIPHLTNRINDNLRQFFLASTIEKKNMESKEYAYDGYNDILKITGSPRYDGLKNNDKRKILITPSWRNYLASPILNIQEKRSHNSNFSKSKYFEIYNNLINNRKLIDTANKYGYKIIYLLHPCTSPQIDDYEKNESVELIASTDELNYEKILTESSLMVTDYSGVQFDFAYMYKPIVYFHSDELPPSYEEGEYKYETMALGEIVKEQDKLVELLCEYMKDECKIKEEYKERIDKFFKYHDFNNCKRIYNEMISIRREDMNDQNNK